MISCDLSSLNKFFRFLIQNKEIILLGDTNCDELCTDTKNNITKLLESIYCNYQFKQTIKMSTHVTNKTSTFIDHFAKRNNCVLKVKIDLPPN